ncbi:MAG: DNA-processing protein DprA [Candidatus Eisenbacteria bacterium]
MRLENTEACRARVKLALVRGIQRTRLIALLESAGAPERLFLNARKSLSEMTSSEVSALNQNLSRDTDAQIALGGRVQAEVLAYSDDRYPELLKHIQCPPIVLFARGDSRALVGTAVAIVGSRKCSPTGRRVAERFGRGLAAAGVIVVSGLARGIDSQAHLGALAGGGRTVAVLGSGVDVCYPRENRGLSEEILKTGVVVSEFPFGAPPLRQHFPLRNRIISGVCRGVVVVEAGEGSGALVTASHALEQGRDVFVIPGDTTISSTVGSNRLLKEGARPVTEVRDVLQALAPGLSDGHELPVEASGHALELSEEEEAILEYISHIPTHVDEVCEQVGLEAQSVLPVLLSLEIKGLVRQEPGNKFVRLVET